MWTCRWGCRACVGVWVFACVRVLYVCVRLCQYRCMCLNVCIPLPRCVCVRAHVCLIVYTDEMSDAVELLLWKLQQKNLPEFLLMPGTLLSHQLEPFLGHASWWNICNMPQGHKERQKYWTFKLCSSEIHGCFEETSWRLFPVTAQL